ncbi:hypothetical protein CIPAW_03G176300 [Carya illinoinensis]|uniref:Uncharacterized protein n=1 Tax=Carya illinoinensis TaxID=32201 RepID=A0A8T1R3I8_CARIL|nr:hypothetical protein CIPAW_03G176300 [Carya illinoinensis]
MILISISIKIIFQTCKIKNNGRSKILLVISGFGSQK